MDITRDIQSMTSFRNRSAEFVRHLKETGRPMVLTVNGKAAAVVQNAEAYQRLLGRGATIWRAAAPDRRRTCSTKFAPPMTYRVELTARAGRNLRTIYRNIHAEDSARSRAWFNGLERAVLSLEERPGRCPPTPEDPALRHLLYRAKPHTYRVIFAIDDRGRVVTVLHVRHGAREPLRASKPQSSNPEE